MVESMSGSELQGPAGAPIWTAGPGAVWTARAVDAVVVAAELDRLAFATARTAGSRPVVRNRALTLLVHAPDGPVAERALAAVARLAARYPGRAALVVAGAGSRRPPSLVSVSLLAGMEVVRLAAGDHPPLAELTRPLWLPGLPCVTWWLGRPPTARQVRGLAGSLVVDSADFPSPRRDLGALSALAAAGQPIVDLNWQRLQAWRAVIARWLAPAAARLDREGMAEVLVEHGGSARAAALLLGGWLATCRTSYGDTAASQSSPRIRIVQRRTETPTLVAVTLRLGLSGARFSAQQVGGGAIETLTVRPGGQHTAWSVGSSGGELGDELGRCLDQTAADPEFFAALTAGLRLAGSRR